MTIEQRITVCAEEIERALHDYLKLSDHDLERIAEAQAYSLLGGGKRIRPFLVLTFCEVLGGKKEKAIPLACALEMIHTYSLIHDDLPCMDDDTYRRGKLTNHMVFGEATAVLAGDALLTKAFETVSSAEVLSDRERVEAVLILARAAGDRGMIGGQVMDMGAQGNNMLSLSYLEKMHSLKTGALIKAAAALGCLAAEQTAADIVASAELYAEKIGLAFQVIDDILDEIGDKETLGKSIGKDHDANKLTFLRFYNVEQANEYATMLTRQAQKAIEGFDEEKILFRLADYLLNRKK